MKLHTLVPLHPCQDAAGDCALPKNQESNLESRRKAWHLRNKGVQHRTEAKSISSLMAKGNSRMTGCALSIESKDFGLQWVGGHRFFFSYYKGTDGLPDVLDHVRRSLGVLQIWKRVWGPICSRNIENQSKWKVNWSKYLYKKGNPIIELCSLVVNNRYIAINMLGSQR